MPTQDFIFSRKIDIPRHDQNMPEGIEVPPADAWKADRPGDGIVEKTDQDVLLGNTGPNIGYALKLTAFVIEELELTEHEHPHDVEMIIAEIGMRRASYFGRAPVKADIEFAAHLLGYDLPPTKGEEKWRPQLVNGCGHDEHRRRRIVNSVPQEVIVGKRGGLHEAISGWWEKLEDLF